MIVAFCLYKYFPFGGLQRDFMRIASTVAARGHHVRVYTQSWEGDCPEAFELIRVPVKSHTNHGRNAEYYAWVQNHLKAHPADRVVGFNKMPGLDVYFAADVCYAEKVAQEKGFFYRLTSRYRHYAAFERATFEHGKSTKLMMLTDKQIADFQKHYQTEPERFQILPRVSILTENTTRKSQTVVKFIARKMASLNNKTYCCRLVQILVVKVWIAQLKLWHRYQNRYAIIRCCLLLARINRVNLKCWQKNSVCVVKCISFPGGMMCLN